MQALFLNIIIVTVFILLLFFGVADPAPPADASNNVTYYKGTV